MAGIICLAIGLVVFVYVCSIYNKLITKKNKVLEAIAGIDVQLKKRYDLLPNLVNSAKAYLNYEKDILEKIVLLRKQGMKTSNLDKKFLINDEISNIIATLENYPELKANAAMLNLMKTNSEIEEHIAAARRFYNSAVNDLNNTIEVFPNSIFAKIFNIDTKTFYKTNNNERQNINIGLRNE